MKATNILFVLLLALQICACSGHPTQSKKTMTEETSIGSEMKSICMTNEYDSVKIDFDRNGLIIRKETKNELFDCYVYDENGRLLSYNELSRWYGGHTFYHELTYDEKGFLIADNGSGVLSSYSEYKNDDNGNCIEEIKYNPQVITIKRIYNDKNQMVEQWVHSYIHSVGKNLDTGERYEEDDPFESPHAKYKYNDWGNMILRELTDGNTTLTDTITYRYDKNGNWIEKNHTNPRLFQIYAAGEDGIRGHKIKRTIEYYKQDN